MYVMLQVRAKSLIKKISANMHRFCNRELATLLSSHSTPYPSSLFHNFFMSKNTTHPYSFSSSPEICWTTSDCKVPQPPSLLYPQFAVPASLGKGKKDSLWGPQFQSVKRACREGHLKLILCWKRNEIGSKKKRLKKKKKKKLELSFLSLKTKFSIKTNK